MHRSYLILKWGKKRKKTPPKTQVFLISQPEYLKTASTGTVIADSGFVKP